MKRKEYQTIIILLSVIVLLLVAVVVIIFFKRLGTKPESVTPSETGIQTSPEVVQNNSGWSIDSLKEGMVTVIDYKVQYNDNITSLDEAEKRLAAYGEEQRAKYDNPKVEDIEKRIEEKYGIFAVNLGEMDEATALDVERAVEYMYSTYPQLKGTLTNITLANIDGFTTGHLAITECREYIINGSVAVCPYVMKYQILLSASSFLNRDNLLKKCEDGVASGHWIQGTDISALVVHELGHQLESAYEMDELGYSHPYYITEENNEAFSMYITDKLKVNQTFSKSVMDSAYAKWEKTNPNKSYEDFCMSISEYAMGKQSDGGTSYPETFAEAVTDIYINGDNASYASKCILEAIKER